MSGIRNILCPDGLDPHPIRNDGCICAEVELQITDAIPDTDTVTATPPDFYAHIFSDDTLLSVATSSPPDPGFLVDPANVSSLENNTFQLDNIPDAQADTEQILSVWVADPSSSSGFSNMICVFEGDDGDNVSTDCDCDNINNNLTKKGKRRGSKGGPKTRRKDKSR
jgi:hypothetical protein